MKRLKLTTRIREYSGGGHTTKRLPLTVHVGAVSAEPAKEQQNIQENIDEFIYQEPSIQMQRASASQQWQAIHEELLHAIFANNLYQCHSCKERITSNHHAHVRCNDCSSYTYFCSVSCCKVQHSWDMNPFHKPMLWEVRFTKYFVIIEVRFNV